ncbi:MAG TPA: HAMP domain-containing sensor histidine kinase [Candidatus Saccharibacteria bacterium]|nr:HAMP domain-containing sensor histidine kinase [Candidatus Saccharibacteria bacterium]
MNSSLAIAVISISVSLLTSAAIWSKASRKFADKIYVATSGAYIILGLVNYLSTITTGAQKLFYARLVMVFTCLAIVGTYELVIAILRPEQSKKLSLRHLGILVAAISGLTPLVVEGFGGGDSSKLIFGLGMVWFGAIIGYHVVKSILILTQSLINASDRNAKGRAKYLLVGFMPVLFLAPITSMYLPAAKGDLRFISLTPVYSAFFVLMVGYAMIKHKLFDLKTFVLRATAYSLTMLVLSVLYITPALLLFGWLAQFDASPQQFILMVLIGTVIATNYSRVKGIFNKATNRFFFRDAFEPAEMIADLNRALVGTSDIQKLLTATIRVVETNLKPEYCYCIVRTPHGENRYRIVVGTGRSAINKENGSELLDFLDSRFKKNNTYIEALPVDSELRKLMSDRDMASVQRIVSTGSGGDDVLAYLVTGVRKSGKAYDQTDTQVLVSVAGTLTIAIQNALHFEEIQQFNLTLQERVEDATRKLRATNDKLKKLDETKDEFISMASHQMRTPLTSVKGYLSMVLDGDVGKLNKQQEELLKQSFLSSQRMVNLISDLLNLSRLNTGKFVIDATSVDLRDVVEQELMQLREVAKSRDIALDYTRPESFPVLQIDENKMHQVVMNFIDNAVYYTPNGGTVSVSLVETPTTIEYRVKDTGIGVPREVQRHLFTKFYRAENAKRARPDGTGLGLFMAKKVIVAQGGAVIFESEEGKGSTFGFRFAKAVLASEQGVEAAAAAKLGTKK